jgi:hypothetical protein
MAILRVYKRNSTFMDITQLIENLSQLGLTNALEKYYNKPVERETKSIVAGPSFLQFLDNLFKIHITPGDVIELEYGNNIKYYMLSTTGTWDEILKLN